SRGDEQQRSRLARSSRRMCFPRSKHLVGKQKISRSELTGDGVRFDDLESPGSDDVQTGNGIALLDDHLPRPVSPDLELRHHEASERIVQAIAERAEHRTRERLKAIGDEPELVPNPRAVRK